MNTFISKVFRKQKILFYLFILFFLAQTLISLKRGLIASPFYNFGMFSEKCEPKDQYEVLEIYSNGKKINGLDYNLHTWDVILLSYLYMIHAENNKTYYDSTIKPFLEKMRIHTDASQFVDLDGLTNKKVTYEKWKTFASKKLGMPIDSAVITNKKWNGNILVTN